MITALLFGIAASSSLVLGASIGATRDVPDAVVGTTLAFASGALFTAVAFELFEPAIGTSGAMFAGTGLLVGGVVFTVIDWFLDEYVGGEEGVGLALAVSVTLDGVPENAALGVALAGATEGGPFALLAAIFASNFPEALDGSEFIVREGRSTAYAVGLWTAVAVLLTLAVVTGAVLFGDVARSTLALVKAFAAGSVLAAIADEILPKAYEEGGPLVAIATTAGFFLTFLLQ